MLKEKIIYKDELPINVVTANIDKYPIHFHDDMEVVYVLEGSISLRNGYYTYTLKQGDIFILNDREMHSFENTGEDNMVMMIQLDLSYFSRYYDNLKNNFFVTDMEDDSDESLEVLRTILARIMMEVLQKGYGYEHKVIESTHNLIACLMSDFQYFVMEDGKFKNESRNKGNKILAGRLNRITDYMYDNYSRKLTLGEIADNEHLSIYYLSHIIKEATGLSFQDLLSYIRVEESEKLLLGTNKKIGAIAEETGFSAVRYYIKHFENWFGMHPLEYRKKYIGKIISREIEAQYTRCTPAQIEDAIRKQVKGVYADYADKLRIKPVIIDIDIYDDRFYPELVCIISIYTLDLLPYGVLYLRRGASGVLRLYFSAYDLADVFLPVFQRMHPEPVLEMLDIVSYRGKSRFLCNGADLLIGPQQEFLRLLYSDVAQQILETQPCGLFYYM